MLLTDVPWHGSGSVRAHPGTMETFWISSARLIITAFLYTVDHVTIELKSNCRAAWGATDVTR